MSDLHEAYLSLGSNIEPKTNLVRAIEQLQGYGRIERISSAWESESFGADGPNYLNACILLATPLQLPELKQSLLATESSLGRERSADKFAPRTIDIDIVLFDGIPGDDKYWEQAFVVVPLAEIYAEYRNPLRKERMLKTAARLRRQVWMKSHPTLLSQFDKSSSPS